MPDRAALRKELKDLEAELDVKIVFDVMTRACIARSQDELRRV